MNTRTPIQPATHPAVLSVSFSATGNRFIAALSDGLRCFRTDNCLTTYHPTLPLSSTSDRREDGYAIAEQLDDRYLALTAGGRRPAGKLSVLVWWDAVLGREVSRFDFREEIKGLRLSTKTLVVILEYRVVVFLHQTLKSEPRSPSSPGQSEQQWLDRDAKAMRHEAETGSKAPNLPKSLYPTGANPYALATLQGDTLALPAQSTGQVQLITLTSESSRKRVLRAHTSSLRQLALSSDGALLATASEQGTLIRVFDTHSTDQLFEFRRGVDHAVILSLAFSPCGTWLASTSDKGTLHVFDLRPPEATALAAQIDREARERKQQHRKSQSLSHNPHRLSTGPSSSLSGTGRSSPASITPSAPVTAATGTGYQGSVQEYYGLRPVPASASPSSAGPSVSAMAALKASPWAPRVFKDVRSVASAAFSMGDDPPHWQGGISSSWTTAPDGRRVRIKHPVPPLPADPNGRPPKGKLCIKTRKGAAGDDEGAVIYVVGGGSDATWEMFELVPAEGGGWALLFIGFRRYLDRQFVG
ncbi:hypothetical protein KC331_g3804 [Hortaea werneckii]|uniref:Uncharacterized protein n=1 Tax=Hortaea werneckii TaxID=91943 RepID=A0A3M7CZ83_HORWE|nr:hypothetical protein KC331_g3804 [Hortaea werneckii]KAI7716461.1 hypothetical protein KC353_g5366 [Hortaea werneckii]RMY57448.1 hypothetical protein D0865_03114 [Hortaea werneckii]